MSTFELHYEQLVTAFESKRRELLSLLTSVIPKPTEIHRRKWRVKQLDNSVTDLKTTIAACNHQLEEERSDLDELNNEYDRLSAQERKLTEDVKMLEGVTGIQAIMPCNADNECMHEINAFSEHFRTSFAEYYFNMPPIRQELPSDPTLSRDSKILISTLRDYINLQFDSRATDAQLSKSVADKQAAVQKLEKQLAEDEARIDREISAQRSRIEQSANRMKESIQEQGRQLRKQGHKLAEELKIAQDDLIAKVQELEGKERRLKQRCSSLASQNKATRENFKRRANDIELELDRLENRLDSIKSNPCVVDTQLVNISLILSKKSRLINKAIGEIREQITEFNQWLRH